MIWVTKSSVSPEDYATLDTVYRTKEKVQTMLLATLEQERQKIYQKGQAEGIEAQRQTLLRFVQWRFQTSEEEQAKLAQQLAQINRLHLNCWYDLRTQPTTNTMLGIVSV
jgi:hypothetical protein